MNILTASINLAQYHALRSKKSVRRANPEEILQRACIEWADAHRSIYPDLEYLFHPANGGGRSAAEAGVLKATGVRAGVSDLLLPFTSPSTGLHGLALELKSPTGRLSDSQRRWLTRFARNGYLSAVIRSIDDFIKCVETWYGSSAVEVDADFEVIPVRRGRVWTETQFAGTVSDKHQRRASKRSERLEVTGKRR